MSASIQAAPIRRPVRAPFRLLAAFIGVILTITAIGTPFLIWRGVNVITIDNIVMLPLTAWFARLMFHAAVYGNTPASGEYWPLASRGVWNCYALLLLAYWVLKA
jgi:uncharacterized membrane protein